MLSFIYFFWSAMFGGIIGSIFGVMLSFKIYGNLKNLKNRRSSPNEKELQPGIQEQMISVREPV